MSIAYVQSDIAKMRLSGMRGPVEATIVDNGDATNFIAYLGDDGQPAYFPYTGFGLAPNDPGPKAAVGRVGDQWRLRLRKEQVLHIGRIGELEAVRRDPPFKRFFKDEAEPVLGGGLAGAAA